MHRRSVGQGLTLTAHRGLDETPEKDPDPANQEQREAQQGQGIAVFAAAAACAQEDAANHSDTQDAENDADQPQIEAHIAIENMAELVAEDTLQFVTLKQF